MNLLLRTPTTILALTLLAACGTASTEGALQGSDATCGRPRTGTIALDVVLPHTDTPVYCSNAYSLPTMGSGSSADRAIEIDGVLTSTEANALVVDTCLPTEDCHEPYRFAVTSDTLDLTPLPSGALVHVSLSFQGSFGCRASLLVTTIASLRGTVSPFASAGVTLVEAGEGLEQSRGSDVHATARGLGCGAQDGGTCGVADDYAFDFSSGGAASTALMGETVTLAAGAFAYQARNVLAYSTGICDDGGNFGFWIRYTAP